jgi:hypothetical protein
LLRWGLKRAKRLGKRVLLSSPQGKYLCVKYGFKNVSTVSMNLEGYSGRGAYLQGAMIWNEVHKECDEIEF